MIPVLALQQVQKSFTMHLQGGKELPVVAEVSFAVGPSECVVLGGPSGAGKSSLLKMIYGNYRCDQGRIHLRSGGFDLDIAAASPRQIIALRQGCIGYVSQFLRVIPRIGALDIVTSSARDFGMAAEEAEQHAIALFRHLSIPERLWSLPPATFSGGEQQRVNIARGFVASHPLLLLDEPTASLDEKNREAVVALIQEKKQSGTAILGIFHDEDVRDQVADRILDVTQFRY